MFLFVEFLSWDCCNIIFYAITFLKSWGSRKKSYNFRGRATNFDLINKVTVRKIIPSSKSSKISTTVGGGVSYGRTIKKTRTILLFPSVWLIENTARLFIYSDKQLQKTEPKISIILMQSLFPALFLKLSNQLYKIINFFFMMNVFVFKPWFFCGFPWQPFKFFYYN